MQITGTNTDRKMPSGVRLAAAAGVALMTFGVGVVWYFDPSRDAFLPACPLYRFTGYACSGCGFTRGFHALLHGDIAGALDLNAMIPIFLIIFGTIYVSLVLTAVRGRALPGWLFSLPVVWGFIGLLIVFAVVRNIPVYPFTWLFP